MAQSEALPGISCLCKSYGRVAKLEEAIQCFLLQDYAGPKELIILNDLDLQELRFEHPQVRIINVAERFATLGDKHNALAQMATYDLLAPWDDDDIYLPTRLSTSARSVGQGFFKPRTALFWAQGRITGFESNLFHAQSCYTKALWQAVGGYPPMDVGEDAGFEERLAAHQPVPAVDLPPADAFYIYRWFGDVHLSHVKRAEAGGDPYQSFDADVRASIANGQEPGGVVALNPHWKADYVRLALPHQQANATVPKIMDLN